MLGIRVRRFNAEKLRLELRKLGLLDSDWKAEKDASYVYFPVKKQPPIELLNQFDAEIIEKSFRPSTRKRTLTDLLKDVLSPHELATLPTAIDIVGDIAIIELPEDLISKGEVIGKTIMKIHRNVKAVYAKKPVSGEFRIRGLIHLAGERKTLTVHKEYNVSLLVDVAKAFFSPRLSWEHNRVANQVTANEVVVDMFTGVGPFAIHIAKKVRLSIVYAIDLNPYAYELLLKNIRLNRVRGNVVPLHGDASEILEKMPKGFASRVIMDHPSEAHKFLGSALYALKRGGKIHYYRFMAGDNPVRMAAKELTQLASKIGRKIKILYGRKVKSSAPREWLVVVEGKAT